LLENLSEEIRECHECAEECARLAAAAADEELRAYYLRREQNWLKLAHSYELRQRLTLFINEAFRRKNDLNQSIHRSSANN
jgi:hypothetical protein